jgi:hypothetical protein
MGRIKHHSYRKHGVAQAEAQDVVERAERRIPNTSALGNGE